MRCGVEDEYEKALWQQYPQLARLEAQTKVYMACWVIMNNFVSARLRILRIKNSLLSPYDNQSPNP